MPELPEVETVRASLARDMIGKKIKSVAVTNGRVVRRHKTAKDFRALLEGHTIKSAQRLGKNLIFGLDNGNHLVIHLGMSGQLLRAKGTKEPKPKHTHVVFCFAQGEELRYVDPRTFGELFVSIPPRRGRRGRGLEVRPTLHRWRRVGATPATSPNSRTSASIRSRTRSAGIGSQRSCAAARRRSRPCSPTRTSSPGSATSTRTRSFSPRRCASTARAESLSTIEIRRLHRAISEILTEAIKYGGTRRSTTNSSSTPTANLARTSSTIQVYDREGLPCYQCRQPIQRVVLRGRSTFFCEKCQS